MSDAVFEILRKVTTATITTMLLRKGIRRCWMNGPKPIGPAGSRIVGRAFTLRFVPVREDVATIESWGNPVSTRAAVEEMPEGSVVIPQAMVDYVASEGAEHELYESWVFSEVENGVKLPGLYPPNDEAKARYAAWRKSRSGSRRPGEGIC